MGGGGEEKSPSLPLFGGVFQRHPGTQTGTHAQLSRQLAGCSVLKKDTWA